MQKTNVTRKTLGLLFREKGWSCWHSPPPLTHVPSMPLLSTLCPQVLLLPDLRSLSPHASCPGEKWGMKELSWRSSLWKNPWNKIRSFVINLTLPYLLCLIPKGFLFLSLDLHCKRKYSLLLIKPRPARGRWLAGGTGERARDCGGVEVRGCFTLH